MTETIERRPTFISLLLDDLKEGAAERGVMAFVSVKAIACLSLGATAAACMPRLFWIDPDNGLGVAATVMGAILTFNALMLALTWSAFSRIHESICQPEFSAWLRKNKLLSGYFFIIDWIHGAQVVAAATSLAGLIAILFPTLAVVTERVIFGAVLATSGYALLQAMSAVRLMHDVVWQHSTFEGIRLMASGTVTPIRGTGR